MDHNAHPVPGSDVEMQLLTAPGTIKAGTEVPLSFKPVRPANPGATVTLARQHEADLHLIVLDAALGWFRHLHPVLQTDGSYQVNITFPAGGHYLLYADYQPKGAQPVVDRIPLQVTGSSRHPVIATGEKLTAITGRLSVALDLTTSLHTGMAALLPFRIERDGRLLKATELSPYLGAVAHLILIHQTGKDFLHIHPEAGTQVPVVAHTRFEKPGIYRMWIQFNADGELHTADFTLDVKKAAHPSAPAVQQHVHHHG